MRYARDAIFLIAIAAALSGCEGSAPRSKQPITTTQAVPVSRSAENGPVKVTVEADRDAVIVPQPVELMLTVESERGVSVTVPELKGVLGDFLVKSAAKVSSTSDDMHDRQSWAITLEPALSGDSSISPLIIEYSDTRERADGSQGEVSGSVETPAIEVRVIENLADVKDPASLPIPGAYTVLLWVLGVLGTMAAVALLSRWLRRGPSAPTARSAPRVPAHEWALAQLDMLAAEGLVERGKIQDFYYRINFIVRRYIELRFGLMAGEQTSEEFVRELQRAAILAPEHKDVLRQFVSACDPVKYAKHQPDASEIDWVQTTARQFVLQTAAPQESQHSDGTDGNQPQAELQEAST
ncbi:hypothetical protein B7486_13595 [cyanobacterium TDX16]|nr:hypothetical protein B7486_13595 [cyanobacterium TDX16]